MSGKYPHLLNSSPCYLPDYLVQSSPEKLLKERLQTYILRIVSLTIISKIIPYKNSLNVGKTKEKIQS